MAKGHIEPELFDEFFVSKATKIAEQANQVRREGGQRDVDKAMRKAKSYSLAVSPIGRGGAGIGAYNNFVAAIENILT